MNSLSLSTEIPLESTLLRCKIVIYQERIDRVNCVDKQALRSVIHLFEQIQNDADFLNDPSSYLNNWCFSHPHEALAIEKIREVLEESCEVNRACKL